ncbi:MAG: gamma-butyrobetaine hydroxylase-like domain-containing protein [Steroidobacteraceae bacterium]
MIPPPTGITVRQKSRVLEVVWADGTSYALPFEYLRELGELYDIKWARHLERCEKLGYERKQPT